MHLTKKHVMIISFLTIGVFVVVAFLLVTHVSKADFRLSARTEFVGIETESEVVFKLPLSGWTLFNITKLDLYKNSDQQQSAKDIALAARNQADETLFFIRIPAGTKILIRRYYDESPRYQLVIAGKPFEVHLQFPKLPNILTITDSAGNTYDETFTENITAQIGPSIEPQLDFRVVVDELQLATGFLISDVGFARQPEKQSAGKDGQVFTEVFPGLLNGWISFLDMPSHITHFARGSDVRFLGVNAAIDSLSFATDGIEINASGTVEDVQIHIGRGARSLMPTQFDKWKNDPVTEIVLGALSALFAVATLLLTAMPVFRGFFK